MNDRQKTIIKFLTEEHSAKIGQLAELFHVSDETIRRDLKHLEDMHLLKRVHGGAVCDTYRAKESDHVNRRNKNIQEKIAIGRLAAACVDDGDSLAISNGTTTMELVKALRNKKNLTIITNSLDIAMEAAKNETTCIYVLGGQLRRDELSISGVLSNQIMSGFRVDKTFFGIGGISPEYGITDYHVEESLLTQTMLKSASTKIGLMDFSKIAITGMKKICDVKDLDILIVDWNVSIKEQTAFRSAGVKVMVARQPDVSAFREDI